MTSAVMSCGVEKVMCEKEICDDFSGEVGGDGVVRMRK